MAFNSQTISFAANQYVTLGNTLQFDSNQSWSAASVIEVDAPPPGPSAWLPGGGASLVFGNTNGAPYRGFELWIDYNGDLRVRIMSSFLDNQYIDVAGMTNIADGHTHLVGATYNGSGTASGVTLYVDGVAERSLILSDTLVGSSAGNGPMIVGNQLNGWQDQFHLGGDMLDFFLSDVARDSSYFQQDPATAPAYDSHTQVAFNFSAGSGLTANDLSGHSHDGVLSSATMWKPPQQHVAIYDTTTGSALNDTLSQRYTGPVSGIQMQFVDITTDSLNITVTAPNYFIRTGAGNDAITLLSGTNVVDGGTGSNFLIGGSGTDTFFVDARGAVQDTWSTVRGFHSGDAATIWGISPSSARLAWADNQGAVGSTGLTLHATTQGQPTASLTLAGLSQADLASGRITTSIGHNGGGDYLYVHAS